MKAQFRFSAHGRIWLIVFANCLLSLAATVALMCVGYGGFSWVPSLLPKELAMWETILTTVQAWWLSAATWWRGLGLDGVHAGLAGGVLFFLVVGSCWAAAARRWKWRHARNVRLFDALGRDYNDLYKLSRADKQQACAQSPDCFNDTCPECDDVPLAERDNGALVAEFADRVTGRMEAACRSAAKRMERVCVSAMKACRKVAADKEAVPPPSVAEAVNQERLRVCRMAARKLSYKNSADWLPDTAFFMKALTEAFDTNWSEGEEAYAGPKTTAD